ncbi:MAG: hypothetical protein ACLVGA_10120 [Dysosmobacter sp.]
MKDSLYAAMDVGCIWLSAPWPASKPIYPHPIRVLFMKLSRKAAAAVLAA